MPLQAGISAEKIMASYTTMQEAKDAVKENIINFKYVSSDLRSDPAFIDFSSLIDLRYAHALINFTLSSTPLNRSL
jgi:hypothetical protein